MGLEFGNPAMLLGTLLFTVPLIIHLFNRRRYRVKRWAAMDFLMAAYRRTRKRLRLENFLLLLLRCLLIILLAAAMAKPFVSSESAMAALSSTRRDVVVVLDHSYSMGYRLTPDETCFDLARKRISALLEQLDAGRGDTVTMVLMGTLPEQVIPFQSVPDVALARLERIREPVMRGADFSALANFLAGEVTANIEGRKEVYIFTDLQALTFRVDADHERAATAALLKRAVEAGAEIVFVDVGKQSPYPMNLAVMGVETLEPYVTTDSPTTFIATIHNYSDGEVPDCRGTFVLDGKVLEAKSVSLKPGASTAVESTLTVHDPGFHSISFRLEPDDLPPDDEWWHAFDARQTVGILLVDGSYSTDPLESATVELKRVINPLRIDGGQERGTVFEPVVKDFKLFNAGRVDIDAFDCVILSDVEGVSDEMAQALANYTRSGGSVVVFLGDRVDLAAYNLRLFGPGEDRLMPLRLEEVMGDSEGKRGVNYFRMSIADTGHPMFDVFRDPVYRPLLEVPVFNFVRTGEVPEDVKVLALFKDVLERSFPAVLERSVGKGRVILFTTSASAGWSLLPETPVTFLPLIHSMLYHLTSRDPEMYNLQVGTSIRRTVADFPERIALSDPSGTREMITEAVERREFGRYLLPLWNKPLDEIGPYFLEVDFSATGRTMGEYYTANLDPTEGNLRRMDADSLDTLFPDCGLRIVESTASERAADGDLPSKGEIWKPLMIALLVLVGLELLLSWKFGDYA